MTHEHSHENAASGRAEKTPESIGIPDNFHPMIQTGRGMNRRHFMQVLGLAAAANWLQQTWAGDDRKKQEHHPPLSAAERKKMEEEVFEHLNNSKVELVPASEAVHDRGCCIDGRNCSCSACTPGGDIGDIVLKVATHEQLSGRNTARSAGEILDGMIRNGKRVIYMHTDIHAMERVAKRMGLSVTEVKYLTENPGGRQEELLTILTENANIGCAHLRFMASKGTGAEKGESGNEQYPGARPELVKELIKEMYRRKWKGDKHIVIDPLDEKHPDHKERAVVVVRTKGPVTANTLIPRVQPNVNGHQVFVLHPDLESYSQEQFAGFAHDVTGLPAVPTAVFSNHLRDNRQTYLTHSARQLVNGKPIVEVTYNQTSGKFERLLRR
ncbi:MAG: hypothetical protein Greene041619_335 [Candidatus Peregrinibacteria bacterium Greene0416_19]|nr:MAG: hypothetical protein Greene041619_335 [Candidatus Peregrinibacteria bacterium Greene0416_19]